MIVVQGPILRGDGSVFIGRVKFKALWSPVAINGDPVLPAIVTVNCAAPDGGFAIVGNPAEDLTLAAGTWQVTFPSAPEVPAIYLAVPDADDQIPFADLMAPGVSEADALINPRWGHGSPEGVITAGLAAFYWDLDAKAFWIKDTDGGNVGWRELIA